MRFEWKELEMLDYVPEQVGGLPETRVGDLQRAGRQSQNQETLFYANLKAAKRVGAKVVPFDGLRLCATARTSRLHRFQTVNRITVKTPTIDTTNQLLHAESKLDHVQRTLGRAVASNSIAIRDDESIFIQMRRRCRTHRSVWDIDCARNVTSLVGFR